MQKTPLTALSQLLQDSRLIIVTNRGPVEYDVDHDETVKQKQGAGGVVTTLTEVSSQLKVVWVAMAMTEGDRIVLRKAQENNTPLQYPTLGSQLQLRYVIVPEHAYHKYYVKISNQLLWFIQHYLHDLSEIASIEDWIQDAWNNGYYLANQAIADAVSDEIEHEVSRAIVMIHDYHLYLTASMIRQHHPSAIIQHFIHIPWPDIRYWHLLPYYIVTAIYHGLMGSDIIAFHTERDARNFLEGAHTLLQGATIEIEKGSIRWKDRLIRVQTYPGSISPLEVHRTLHSVAGKQATEKIIPFLGEKNIVRVDRIEPTKNILRGFLAYSAMLDAHPDLLGKVNFLAFLIPSRQESHIYQQHKAEIFDLIEEINQKYSQDGWIPIHVFNDNDRTQALAAMQFYDVLIVNPLIDGMNMVAKEGSVANKQNGVLVLSRTAGAFQQLQAAAIPVSPFDVTETAQALYQALTLPAEERLARAQLARQIVEHYDLNMWLTRQLDDLSKLSDTPYKDEHSCVE